MHTASKYIEAVLKLFIVISITILICSTSLQILVRHVIKFPLPWTEELTRFSFIWSIMLAIPLGSKYNRQLGIDLVLGRIPLRFRSIYLFIIELLTLCVALLFIYISWEFWQKNFSHVAITMPLSMKYIYISGPICGLLLSFFQLEKMMNKLQEGA